MSNIIYLIFGLIELLIASRLVLRLFGANPGSPFVAWIYNLSSPLVAPFGGIFGQTGNFDLAALVALVVFALVGSLLARFLSAAR